MSLTDRYAELLYRIATSRNKLKIIMTPVGIIFWLGLGVLLIVASLWLDELLPVPPVLPIPVYIFISITALAIGSTLCLWTVYSFIRARGSPVPLNPPQRLVTSGLYSWIRNPMVLGWTVILLGIGLTLNSISLIFIFTPFFFLLNVLYLKNIEEKELEKKFGQQYLKYKESIPMFIPRFGKKGKA